MDEKSPEFLRGLNGPQLRAANLLDGPLLVLAGPGSGKTRVVTARIANLLAHGVADTQIAALTFTNKAADEMRFRLHRQFPGHAVWISTFHRFCSTLLRRYGSLVGLEENFTILDADDSLATVRSVIEDHSLPIGKYSPQQIGRAISNAKNALLNPNELGESGAGPLEEVAAGVYEEYQRRLLRANSVDFDDLLFHVAVMLRENAELRELLDDHFRYLLVDEYQDTNQAQYLIIRGLSLTHPNLAVTGDPDQSIYSWRGADIENILRFERDYPQATVIRLEENYRSDPAILAAADRLIRHNRRRKHKELFTRREGGGTVRIAEYESGEDEAHDIASQISTWLKAPEASPADCAIFCRTNALSRVLERALRRFQIPYQIVHGLEFYRRKEVRDIIAYLQLITNPRNDVAFTRIVNVPPRGIGKVSLEKIREFAIEERISLLEAAGNPALGQRLGKKAAKALGHLAGWLRALTRSEPLPVSAYVERVMEASGYNDSLREQTGEEDAQRLANVKELVSAAREFESMHPGVGLDLFLEQSTLAGETDSWDRQQPSVTIMTLHAAKGLEFPMVFVIAVEQGLLPHERSMREDKLLEEERRLLFVGITRAMTRLQLSYARYRDYAGDSRRRIPSAFLQEVQGPATTFEVRSLVSGPPTASDFVPDIDPEAADDVAFADALPELPSVDEAVAENRGQAPMNRPAEGSSLRIGTAADLLAGPHPAPVGKSRRKSAAKEAPEPPDTSRFRPGALVTHPTYGIGKIMLVTGTGVQTTCRVQFFDPLALRTFRVTASPLEAV